MFLCPMNDDSVAVFKSYLKKNLSEKRHSICMGGFSYLRYRLCQFVLSCKEQLCFISTIQKKDYAPCTILRVLAESVKVGETLYLIH